MTLLQMLADAGFILGYGLLGIALIGGVLYWHHKQSQK